jgi:hypothetical protein
MRQQPADDGELVGAAALADAVLVGVPPFAADRDSLGVDVAELVGVPDGVQLGVVEAGFLDVGRGELVVELVVALLDVLGAVLGIADDGVADVVLGAMDAEVDVVTAAVVLGAMDAEVDVVAAAVVVLLAAAVVDGRVVVVRARVAGGVDDLCAMGRARGGPASTGGSVGRKPGRAGAEPPGRTTAEPVVYAAS